MAALTKSNFKVQSDFNNILITVDYSLNKAGSAFVKAFSSVALDKLEETTNAGIL